MDARQEFLIEMYKQLMSEINRHIVVIWQSVGVLISAFAIFALVEKKVVSLEVAAALIVMLCGWLYAHLLDASYWYNRNLVMIANIERQFLLVSDLRDIHYYFGLHRQNKMITHLKIQMALGTGVGLLVVLFHFVERVLPGFCAPNSHFEPQRGLPYAIAVAAAIYIFRIKNHRDDSYAELIKNSPGKEIDIQQVTFGKGHGYGESGGG